MAADLSVTFTGLRFENPFLLSSAPPTESDSNIMRAFEAGWGGVVTKTIGLHPVTNVAGPEDQVPAHRPGDRRGCRCRSAPGSALHSSWNWELISDKTIDWWLPKIERIKQAHPDRILVASIMAGSGSDKELRHWQELATGCQDAGADAFELNLSCPHMDRQDMGSNVGKDAGLISVVTKVVKEVAKVPVWCKLTPSTTDIAAEARASFAAGADAIVSSNTFPSLPPIDPATLEFEVNVDGYVSSGGLGGPAILPLSLAKMAQMTQAFPDKAFSGHRRHRRFLAGAELLPARLRHRPGLHRRDARPCDRPERDQGAERGAGGVPRGERRPGLDSRSTTSAACAATASCSTRRSGGPRARNTSAGRTRRKATPRRRR